jgi:hypothetical protein
LLRLNPGVGTAAATSPPRHVLAPPWRFYWVVKDDGELIRHHPHRPEELALEFERPSILTGHATSHRQKELTEDVSIDVVVHVQLREELPHCLLSASLEYISNIQHTHCNRMFTHSDQDRLLSAASKP